MYTRLEEAQLISDLLYVLGIDINPTDNILIDQDTHQPIIFEGKNIKATRNINKPAFITEHDIKLEPANPKCTKLMSRLFGFFLDKESKEGEIPEVLSFYFDDDLDAGTSKLVVKFYNNTKFETNSYRCKALIYTEAILAIDESFPIDNLSKFDLDEDVALENIRERRTRS